MSKAQAINTHDGIGLAASFRDNIGDGPWWEKLISNVDTAQEIDLDLGKAKIPLPLKVFRPIAIPLSVAIAARRWLRPSSRNPTVQDLVRLRAAVHLTDLTERAFAEKLRDRCYELQYAHPTLSRWIQRQIALVDLCISPPSEMPSDSVRAAIALRHGLLEAMAVLPVSPTAAAGLGEQIIRNALRAAAFATCSVFGGECRVSANLMVPVRSDRPLPNYATDSPAAAARARADALWSGLYADRRLLVVAETRGAGHVGFWLPVASAPNGEELPGAAYAYRRMAGHTVFKDDLPRLEGFPEKIREQWRDYMQEHFKEQLFVSIPLIVPDSAMAGTGSIVIAVLNVNASPQQEEPWYRAYHQEWLHLVQDRVAAFSEIAFNAVQLGIEASKIDAGSLSIEVDTGSTIWDRLPIADRVRLPPGERS